MTQSGIIYKYFPELSSLQKEQIEMLAPLYADWNSKINVISRKDIDEIYLHHVLHSLAIAAYLNKDGGIAFSNGDSVLDLGTGGGFPGIPLAVLYPQVQFTLCDSIAKKIKVASEVSSALSLQNVRTVCSRAEALPEKYDWVVSRAVTALKDFMPWVKGKYSKGLIFLKGGDTAAEISECCQALRLSTSIFHTIDITTLFREDFFNGKKILFISK